MPTVVMNSKQRLTAEEIEVRVWAFVIVTLVTILLGAMAMFLYSGDLRHPTHVWHGSHRQGLHKPDFHHHGVHYRGSRWCGWAFRYQGRGNRHIQV
jgi:hypothetical protein